MYDDPINHFIFNTGSAYMYIESDGYEFKWSETTGEDKMYMHLPRCVCEINDIIYLQKSLLIHLSEVYMKGSLLKMENSKDIMLRCAVFQ